MPLHYSRPNEARERDPKLSVQATLYGKIVSVDPGYARRPRRSAFAARACMACSMFWEAVWFNGKILAGGRERSRGPIPGTALWAVLPPSA